MRSDICSQRERGMKSILFCFVDVVETRDIFSLFDQGRERELELELENFVFQGL